MRGLAALAAAAVITGGIAPPAFAGAPPDLAALSRIAAVSGYEQPLSAAIAQQLRGQGLRPRTDNMYDVLVTVGHGGPRRLIVAAIDQPGYVVSGIDAQGYLRVQRLPQREPSPVFDTLRFAQPVHVVTSDGLLNGGFAGLSIHLAPDHLNPPSMTTVGNLYVDIGATSAAEAHAAGADILDPVELAQPPLTVGADDEAGGSAGDRFGWEALLEAAQGLAHAHARGTTTIAFVTQQWLGGRGLQRVLTEMPASEMIFVGRVFPQAPGKDGKAASPRPGEGGDILPVGPARADAIDRGFPARANHAHERRGRSVRCGARARIWGDSAGSRPGTGARCARAENPPDPDHCVWRKPA